MRTAPRVPTNMADILENQENSATKRSWSETLTSDHGSGTCPSDRSNHNEEFQNKRSRTIPDGLNQIDEYETSNGSIPSCYESGSDSAEKSLRSERFFGHQISPDRGDGSSPSSAGRPPDGYEDPSSSSSHSSDSNFYEAIDGVENDNHRAQFEHSPSTSPMEKSEDDPASSPVLPAPAEEEEDNVSTISELSGLTVEGWQPIAGPISWVQKQMQQGVDPRNVLKQLVPQDALIPEDFDDMTLWKIVINLLAEPPKRSKLKHVQTLDQAIGLLRRCKRIMVLTGAGVSVSCGIPDFRSRDGIYSRLAVEYPDLPDPQAMFDIVYFKKNPKPFFKFAKEIYPGQFDPSPSHRFIRLLESKGKLIRNYTQNIDTLEQVAGINNVIQCHGSFATATCMVCKYQVDKEAVKEDIMQQVIPKCPRCSPGEEQAIMKPDIVFFGESLPSEFHRQMEIDRDVCDLLIVMGSSLKVRPVALVPNSLPPHVPQILINREPLRHLNFDVELLGDCDVIVNELCHRLGQSWQTICTLDGPSREITRSEMITPQSSTRPSPAGPRQREESSFKLSEEDLIQQMDSYSNSDTTAKPSNADPNTESDQETNRGMVANESSASLCAMVSHLTTDQLDPTISNDSTGSLCAMVGDMTTDHDIESDLDAVSNPFPNTDMANTDSTPDLPPLSNEGTEDEGNREITQGKEDGEREEMKEGKEDTSQDKKEGKSGEGLDEMEKTQEEINDLEDLRACWEPKVYNLASRLKEGTYLYLPPSRYVFQGAEVYDEDDSDDDDNMSQKDDSSSASSSDIEDVPNNNTNPPASDQDPAPSVDQSPENTATETRAGEQTDNNKDTDINGDISKHVC